MDPIEIGDQLEELSTPDIADALEVLGYSEQTAYGIHRMWDDCRRIAGRVMPILLGPEEDGSTAIGTLEAIQDAHPGDVLVFDNQGRLDLNTFGGISSFCASRVGIKGAVCDGASRDVDDMRDQNFPLYARGPVTTTVKGRVGMAGYDIPVKCGDVQVSPGDYVVADGSGVIFIPGDEVKQVLNIGRRFQAYERDMKKRIAQGEDIVHVFKDMDYEDFESRGRIDS